MTYDDLSTLDVRTRRKLKDERRMRFRRAIEHYEEHCRLQTAIADFPELIDFSAVPLPPARRRKSAPQGHESAGGRHG